MCSLRFPGSDDGPVIPGAIPERNVLGVVPVRCDDPGAPGGCAALRELRGVTLLRRAVDQLVGSGRVGRVVLTFGPLDLAPGQCAGTPYGIVVVHDPLHVLAPVDLVRDVVDELLAHPEADGVVPVRSVTDTLKRVGVGGVLTTTADREAFRTVASPQAYRSAALAGFGRDGQVPLGPDVLPMLVRSSGGLLRTVPAPDESFAVTSDEDVLLAEAALTG